MFKRWNIMWKFRWVKKGVLMIHPCCSLTVPISLILSKSILLSALSLYIATVCSQFSSEPVHHLISLDLSNAWIAKRCICGDFMNKSAAINFDYNQGTTRGFHMASSLCSVIIAPSFWRAMINFFGAPYTWRPWSYRPGLTKEKGPVEEQGSLITVIGSCCWKIGRVQCLTGWNKPEGNSHLCPWVFVCVCWKRKGNKAQEVVKGKDR